MAIGKSVNDASLVYLTGTAPIVAAPFTISAWVRSSEDKQSALVVIGQEDDTNRWLLGFRGDLGGDPIELLCTTGAGSGSAVTSTSLSLNTWSHVCAVVTAPNDRAVFLNGGGKGTNGTNLTPVDPDQVRLLNRASATQGRQLVGALAEVTIWSESLTDEQVAMLANGLSPFHIWPSDIVAYWPLHGGTVYPDLSGSAINLTATGSPEIFDQPPIGPRFGFDQRAFAAAAAGGGALPWLYRSHTRTLGAGFSA